MSLYVGTSGWDYREWKPDFYPHDLPRAEFLNHYGASLGACEINATFYRLQSGETLSKWREAVPESFRFATKMHRRLTHGRKLAPQGDRKDFLEAFVRSVSSLGDKLGAVLVQLPPYRRRDDDALLALIRSLPPSGRFACEFRHPSWDDAEVRAMVAGEGGTVCVSETEGNVPDELPPGPLAYVRLRSDRYTPEARSGWSDLLVAQSAVRDVYVFAKHEGIPADDPYGGVGLAGWLSEQTGIRHV
jgi:uncharacterized protein YecE (DUF72 family)